MITIGKKFDAGKPRMDLILPDWELEIGKVLAHGAAKYSENNWKAVGYSQYIAAAKRHLNALHRGILIDPDSGLHQAALLGTNSMFLYHLIGETEANELQRNAGQAAKVYTTTGTTIVPSLPNHYENASNRLDR